MTTGLFIDWENFWIGLRCAGYSVSPIDAGDALVRAMTDVDGEAIGEVVIATKADVPPRNERRMLRQHLEVLTGRPVELRIVQNDKKNGADIALAFLVGKAVERKAISRLILVSADADLVDLGRLAEADLMPRGNPSQSPVTVAYVQRPDKRVPMSGRYALVELGKSCGGMLPSKVCVRRPPTTFDLAAWTLIRSAYGRRRGAEAGMLHLGPVNDRGHPVWWEEVATYRSDASEVELLDSVLWRTNRLLFEERLLVTPAQAADTLARRDPSVKHDVAKILDALLTVDFLRVRRDGSLVGRAALREGLLMPARRAVLRLLREPSGVARPGEIEHTHRHSRYPNVRNDDVQESWALMTQMLAVNWKVFRKKQDQQGITWWRLSHEHQLLSDVRARAAAIQNAFHGRRLSEAEVLQAVASEWMNGRWLRIMRDAQFLNFDDASKTFAAGPFWI